MMRFVGIKLICFTMISWLFMQECPPSDTLSIDPVQNAWNIPIENQWDKLEAMTWNIKDFPISENTINYVNEIITDLMPDVIAFQEINDLTAFNTLANSILAYEFIASGTGLALAVRSDVMEITSWTTLFPDAGYDFAWRFPMLVELNWACGLNAISFKVINVHLKAGGGSEDFNRRYSSCEYLSNYINDYLNVNIIILGDYNDEITDLQNSNSLWPLVSNNAIAFATDPIAGNDYYDSYPSWPSFIDHIAISSTLFDELSEGEINTLRIDDYTGYSFYHNNISDHRPVILSIPIEAIEYTSDLVINEIMQNPFSATDADGEWIEITNVSEIDISLNGIILRDEGGEIHVIADNNLIVEPGNFVVLGSNDDPSLNGGTSIDYQYSGFTLSNLWDEVILSHPNGMIIDEVYYDNGDSFPDESGKSMMLINPSLDNNLGENWAVADIVFGSGDFGTPGQENYTEEECIGSQGDMDENGIYNVLDLVALVNCVLSSTCGENDCTGDLNSDGLYNVLDIVALANCILASNCDN